MAVGIGNFQALFQTFYPERDLPYLIPDNLPFLNMVPKEDGLSGDVTDHVFLYGPKQGYSTDFSTAQGQAGTAPRAGRMSVRTSQAYSMIEFLDKDIALSQGDAAYADLFQKTVSGVFQDFLNNLDLDLHASGTGWRGTVMTLGTGSNTNPYTGATLAANQIVVQTGLGLEAVFNQDQMIQAATYTGFPLANSIFPPADGRSPTTLSNPVQVLAVDAVGRTLTLTDTSSFTAGTFIVQAGGAVGFSSGNPEGAPIGMDAWNPYGGVASTDNICGLNRSTNPTKMAGYWYDGSKLSIEEAIKRLAAKMSQGGARNANVALVNPLDYDALDSKLATFAKYSTFDTAVVGFDSIVISTAAGRVDVVADPHQPQGYARLITPDSWVLRHKMALPHVVDIQGRTVEQGLNFDGRSARVRAYFQLFCNEPQKNGIVKLANILV